MREKYCRTKWRVHEKNNIKGNKKVPLLEAKNKMTIIRAEYHLIELKSRRRIWNGCDWKRGKIEEGRVVSTCWWRRVQEHTRHSKNCLCILSNKCYARTWHDQIWRKKGEKNRWEKRRRNSFRFKRKKKKKRGNGGKKWKKKCKEHDDTSFVTAQADSLLDSAEGGAFCDHNRLLFILTK